MSKRMLKEAETIDLSKPTIITPDAIGKILISIRYSKNLTQKELGDILGVSQITICVWECGKAAPDIDFFVEMLDRFGYELEVRRK